MILSHLQRVRQRAGLRNSHQAVVLLLGLRTGVVNTSRILLVRCIGRERLGKNRSLRVHAHALAWRRRCDRARHPTATVSVQGTVSLPADRTARLIEEILRDLCEKPGHVSLSVDLSADLAAPVEASLSVPIVLTASRAPRENELFVSISSEKHAHLYPRFKGTLRVMPARGGSSVVTLKGSYSVPFGSLGDSIDMTLLRGAARSSLRRFLDYVFERLSERTYAQQRRL